MTLDPQQLLDTFVLKTLLDFETTIKWEFRFRGSALPACPRQLMFGKFHAKNPLNKVETFQTRYHFYVGRAIHALVQHTWGTQGLLWGDWKCNDLKNCGIVITNQLLPHGRCIRCGAECTYEEKTLIDADTGFSGHCDGIVFVKELNGYVVFELKSRNSNIISSQEEPYDSDIFQVSAYATLAKKMFWLPIVGRAVLWIGKPRPKPYSLWYYPGTGEDMFDYQLERKRENDDLLAKGLPEQVAGNCEEWGDSEGCPWRGICFSPNRDKLTRELYSDYMQGEAAGKNDKDVITSN